MKPISREQSALMAIGSIHREKVENDIRPDYATQVEVNLRSGATREELNSLYFKGFINVGKTLNGKWILLTDKGEQEYERIKKQIYNS